ncbi:beta-N-acetylhexosaminidase [Chitinophaga barathri]|uniref:beta-N-acetylhexosaminidase n=1 Tax=Chitinophaga barathri TaxID=1647451 RepID=A0A3N4MDA6_9BACT|nr:family 20 glycosylhydrolase [Chitinophaga barathri]RPD39916.1 beta-hexosaminidase [Chitinophaga barathri]
MRSFILTIYFFITYAAVQAQQISASETGALIPAPVSAKYAGNSYVIQKGTAFYNTTELQPAADLLAMYIQHAGIQTTGVSSQASGKDGIRFRIDSVAVPQPEGYRLSINQHQIDITAHDAAGAYHAVQTLRQSWRKSPGKLSVPGGVIEDYPRFHYRGMHLDVSRHFFAVGYIKKFIDSLALYKFNNFHWHLTDDQGWRIEIKKYPALQTIAAWRNETLIGHKKELPHRFDGKRYGGYYTQAEIKEVVAYAAARGINVIPEIEMPGHALAALAAYPQLGCTGGPYQAATFWGVFDDVFCAGKDSVFTFLEGVLDEVMELFPSPYIHIGGDECPKTRWNACPACKARMAQEKLPDVDALQSYFIRRINAYVQRKGRHIIGWDEILEGGLAPGATVMSWRGTEGAESAAAQKHHVIMTPEDELYFDHYQSLYPEEQLAAGGYTPLQEVYAYEPPLKHFIQGIQGQVWSEYLSTEQRADYMIYPRMLALAEVAWSPQSIRDYVSFRRRLKKRSTAVQYEEVTYRIEECRPGQLRVSLRGGGDIHYTTDGTTPSVKSRKYTGPILITRNAELKAVVIQQGKPAGRMFRQSFQMHQAVGAAIKLKQAPNSRYAENAGILVNGVSGSDRYNDRQWLGFSGRDLEAVIDLGSVRSIQQVGANILNYHWQRMWEPAVLQFHTSPDGVHYTLAATQQAFPANGINAIRLRVPPLRARYVKVTALHKGVIPTGEYGAGGNGLLMVDELYVD